jgi:hypothetical protein
MIHLNRIGDQPTLLKTEKESLVDYVDSSKSQAVMDKVERTKDLSPSSFFVSTLHHSLGIQLLSSRCPSLDTMETVVDCDLHRTNSRSLHVPSPIPIPPFEVVMPTKNIISPQVSISQDFDDKCTNSLYICLGQMKENQTNEIGTCAGSNKKQNSNKKKVLCGNAIKRVKTCRNGLSFQGSFFKEIKSVHKNGKPPRTSYHQQIPTLKALSRIGIQTETMKTHQSSLRPMEKFKVPNPLEPETVPEVIQIPYSPPGNPVEDFPDDISDLGLDDHEAGPEEQSK